MIYNPSRVEAIRNVWLDPPEPEWECWECGTTIYDEPHSLPNGEDCCSDCCTRPDCIECDPLPNRQIRERLRNGGLHTNAE